MPKKRAKSSEEWLRGRIRELEKANRSLERKLKHLEKTEHIFSQEIELSKDTEDTFPDLIKKALEPCHSCGKGFFEEFEILGRVYGTCNVCEDRKRLK